MNAEEIRKKVSEILAREQIKYAVHYVGQTRHEPKWDCDEWRVTFSRQGGEYQADYFTGLGHRKAPAFPKPRPTYRPGTLAHEEYQKTFKPVAPQAADVLHSLTLDAQANGMSFKEWCGELGYDDDSLHALDIYRACCECAVKLRAVFSHAVLEEIRDAVAEL